MIYLLVPFLLILEHIITLKNTNQSKNKKTITFVDCTCPTLYEHLRFIIDLTKNIIYEFNWNESRCGKRIKQMDFYAE